MLSLHRARPRFRPCYSHLFVRPVSKLAHRQITMKQYPQIRLSSLEQNLQSLLVDTANDISASGTKTVLRFAGGWVRVRPFRFLVPVGVANCGGIQDKLLNLSNCDIDVCIDSMSGKQFAEHLKKYSERLDVREKYAKVAADLVRNVHVVEENAEKSKHLEVAKVVVFGLELDFVQLRTDTYAEGSRIPEIRLGSAKEDALRRDSTINSLFYNLETSSVEDFTDYGLDDLEKKIIRTPLDPFETFHDDPLRVLRHIRFASRLNFEIRDQDLEAMNHAAVQQAFMSKIARERVGIEVEKMLASEDVKALRALEFMVKTSLYNTIFTSSDSKSFSFSNRPHHARTEILLSLMPRKGMQLFSPFLVHAEDQYHKWLLFALVPLGSTRADGAASYSRATAVRVVREGLKGRNKTIKVVEDAFRDLGAIQDLIAKDVNTANSQSMNQTQEEQALLRMRYGKAIRSWGFDWRLSVLYAFFVQLSDSDHASKCRTSVINNS